MFSLLFLFFSAVRFFFVAFLFSCHEARMILMSRVCDEDFEDDEEDEDFEDDDEDEDFEDDDEDEDFEDDDEDEESEYVQTISASEVAKLICSEVPDGTEEAQQFGKIFEETYQMICSNSDIWWENEENIIEVFESMLQDDWLDEAAKIALGFHAEGIKGAPCSVSFRNIHGDCYVAAKPDLYDSDSGIYIEFKTYPLNEYARAQAKVFSWVQRCKVLLIGWNNGKVEKEYLDGSTLKLPSIPGFKFSDTYRGKVDPFYVSPRRRYSRRYYHHYDYEFEDYNDIDDDFDEDFDDYDHYYC